MISLEPRILSWFLGLMFAIPLFVGCGDKASDSGSWEVLDSDNSDTIPECSMPFIDSPVGETFISVGAGGNMSCGVTTAGQLKCWGGYDVTSGLRNSFNSCPSQDLNYASVYMSSAYHCALTTDGLAECWSEYLYESQAAPEEPPDVRLSSVSVGDRGSCGISESGDLFCWGGLDWLPDLLPASAYPLKQVEVTNGQDGWVCVVQANGSALCLDEYSTIDGDDFEFPEGFFDGPVKKVVTRSDVICIQHENGELRCRNTFMVADIWYLDETLDYITRGTWVDFDIGGCGICPTIACKLLDGGTIRCDGWDRYDLVNVPDGQYTALTLSHDHVCALDSTGVVTCWGNNSSGSCGGEPTNYEASRASF